MHQVKAGSFLIPQLCGCDQPSAKSKLRRRDLVINNLNVIASSGCVDEVQPHISRPAVSGFTQRARPVESRNLGLPLARFHVAGKVVVADFLCGAT